MKKLYQNIFEGLTLPRLVALIAYGIIFSLVLRHIFPHDNCIKYGIKSGLIIGLSASYVRDSLFKIIPAAKQSASS